MCGFCGIYSLHEAVDFCLLKSMNKLIKHRGPDDEGYLQINTNSGMITHLAGEDSIFEIKKALHAQAPDPQANLGMGFRRLSILDLSAKAHQPMSLVEQGLSIVFNGEIYNYLELREELRSFGYNFHSESDTEVILCAYHHWGEDCLHRFNGMWAFAIWNQKTHTLFCARDRFGIKPLYYHYKDQTLYFGSEQKQILLSLADPTINDAMIMRSLRINALQVYHDETYLNEIKTLPGGFKLLASPDGLTVSEYYHLDIDLFESSKMSFLQASEMYQDLFQDSVRLQLRSDLEVGSCLSGGLDSSAIVCFASQLCKKPFRTFSSYYPEDQSLDESKWIKLIANQISGISSLINPQPQDAIAWFDHATFINDQPLGAGFVSQYAVMKLAANCGIKVLLDGQGSDEQSAGYFHANYRFFADLLRNLQIKDFVPSLNRLLEHKPLGKKIPILAKVLLSALLPESKLYELEFKYYRFNPFHTDYEHEVKLQHPHGCITEIMDISSSRLSNFLYNMMRHTSLRTLLHYEDRMSMAHSIESRVPFLDHRLVEFNFSLPSAYKISPPHQKHIHRQAMKKIVPSEIYNRRDKSIFSSPFYSTWMRNQLSTFFESIFLSSSFRKRGIWNLPQIHQQWRSYQKGNPKPAEMLFNVAALEIWYRSCIDNNDTQRSEVR